MIKMESTKKSNMAERVVRIAHEGACNFRVHGHRGLCWGTFEQRCWKSWTFEKELRDWPMRISKHPGENVFGSGNRGTGLVCSRNSKASTPDSPCLRLFVSTWSPPSPTPHPCSSETSPFTSPGFSHLICFLLILGGYKHSIHNNRHMNGIIRIEEVSFVSNKDHISCFQHSLKGYKGQQVQY